MKSIRSKVLAPAQPRYPTVQALTVVPVVLLLLAAGVTSVVAKGQERPVPFRAAYSAIQGVTVDPLRCPVLTVQAVGGGQAAHLGQFTSVQTHCVNPEGSDPLSFTDGFYTFTAANGDTIFGSYSGRLIPTETPGVFSLDGHFTVAAGTGRFEDASGSGSASGLVNLATGEASVFLQGTISSVGSEKA
jgi:hypothetical protein